LFSKYRKINALLLPDTAAIASIRAPAKPSAANTSAAAATIASFVAAASRGLGSVPISTTQHK
jgi:hypothetical protein